MIRDITYPATFGGDSNIERAYFADFLTESNNYYPLWLAWMDGGDGNYANSISPPDNPGSSEYADTYIMSYVADAAYIMSAWQHLPLWDKWSGKFQRFYEGICGGQLPGAPVSYYCIDYLLDPAIHNGDGPFAPSTPSTGGNYGPIWNGTDASDFGNYRHNWMNIYTGGQVGQSNVQYTLTPGDTLKNMNGIFGLPPLDQLLGNQWFEITGPINNNAGTFYIKCPVGHPVDASCPTPGAAFAGFTRGGVPVSNESNSEAPKLRIQYDPGPSFGYSNNNYTKYGGMTINGLHVLGYNVPHAMSDFNTRASNSYYNTQLPSYWWDPTIIVPGLPTPHNGL
jgi:hypothetical protein